MKWKKGIASGIAAAIVLTALSFTFTLVPGTGEWYSATFPKMVTPAAMLAMTLSLIAVGMFMGLVYSMVNPSIPGRGLRKGLNYGAMVWLLAGIMWPIMMIGFAPARMWAAEFAASLVSYAAAGAAIAAIYEKA